MIPRVLLIDQDVLPILWEINVFHIFRIVFSIKNFKERKIKLQKAGIPAK